MQEGRTEREEQAARAGRRLATATLDQQLASALWVMAALIWGVQMIHMIVRPAPAVPA